MYVHLLWITLGQLPMVQINHLVKYDFCRHVAVDETRSGVSRMLISRACWVNAA